MTKYTKPWLSIDQQVSRLQEHGVLIADVDACKRLLRSVGYYRLTGYLYPFRLSESFKDEKDATRIRVLAEYGPQTRIEHAVNLIDADRNLRILVLDGMERIEVSFRTQIGHSLGRSSSFAHLKPESFVSSFISRPESPSVDEPVLGIAQELFPKHYRSKHELWLQRVAERQAGAMEENFVAHFRSKYDNVLPIWALTEILEMGHLARLYSGLDVRFAVEVAAAYGVPTKTLMVSWFASLNYLRNVSAHQARLFNRKLQTAPARPKLGAIKALDHLTTDEMPKQYGVYNILAVMAYLIRVIEPTNDWAMRVRQWADSFPAVPGVGLFSVGFPDGWQRHDIWS